MCNNSEFGIRNSMSIEGEKLAGQSFSSSCSERSCVCTPQLLFRWDGVAERVNNIVHHCLRSAPSFFNLTINEHLAGHRAWQNLDAPRTGITTTHLLLTMRFLCGRLSLAYFARLASATPTLRLKTQECLLLLLFRWTRKRLASVSLFRAELVKLKRSESNRIEAPLSLKLKEQLSRHTYRRMRKPVSSPAHVSAIQTTVSVAVIICVRLTWPFFAAIVNIASRNERAPFVYYSICLLLSALLSGAVPFLLCEIPRYFFKQNCSSIVRFCFATNRAAFLLNHFTVVFVSDFPAVSFFSFTRFRSRLLFCYAHTLFTLFTCHSIVTIFTSSKRYDWFYIILLWFSIRKKFLSNSARKFYRKKIHGIFSIFSY